MKRNISGGYVDKLVSTDIGKSLEINSTSQLIVILPDRWILFYCLKARSIPNIEYQQIK
jgi:hypothetical protein